MVTVDRPEAFFPNEFGVDQNLFPKGLVIKRSGNTVYAELGGSGERMQMSYSSVGIDRAGWDKSRLHAKEMEFLCGSTVSVRPA